MKTCTIEGCTNARLARGWCSKHYARWASTGDPQGTKWGTVGQRFWAKVNRTDGCWVWTASRTTSVGYGKFWDGKRFWVAHRWAYEELVGPVPAGLELDHLCRNRACVNPAHLDPVTGYINIMRGEGRSAHNARKTHCHNGHPFDAENTYVAKAGERKCRQCRRNRRAAARAA